MSAEAAVLAAASAPLCAEPLRDDEFARCMAALGPFEPAPRLAVAVSGGADSLALTILADRWARARGGRITALTVDHQLRAASAAEAAQVGGWLRGRGIAHRVLPWRGPKPAGAIQDAARRARRDLLVADCREHGVLHLLLGHHRDDQTETLIMRAAAESGRDGMAGMSAVIELPDVRLLRPLLAIPRARLAATLDDEGQEWIEDPSNQDERFLRSLARAAAQAAGVDDAAAAFGGERAARDRDVAAVLASAAAIYPEGWASLDVSALCARGPEIGRRALAAVLLCIGANIYPPRGERLERLYDAVTGQRLAGGRTLAGCRIVPRRTGLLVVRETAAIGPNVPLAGAGRYGWDGRFVVRVFGRNIPPGLRLGRLGIDGWTAIAAAHKPLRALPIPAVVRPSLPAIYDLEGVLDVPHLMYRRQGADPDSVRVVSASFRPRHVLAGAGFAVVSTVQGQRSSADGLGGEFLRARQSPRGQPGGRSFANPD